MNLFSKCGSTFLLASILVCTGAPSLFSEGKTQTSLDLKLEKEKRWQDNGLLLLPHRPNYFLLLAHNTQPNHDPAKELEEAKIEKTEIKYQFSFKVPLWMNLHNRNGHLFFAYTQLSFWQAYNRDASAPFRDTNYEPEGYVEWDTDKQLGPLRNRLFRFGFVHQSNGRAQSISRSWNRMYAEFILDRKNMRLSVKPWWRIPEDEKNDDNPNMEKYYGYGELRGSWKWKRQVFSFMARNNLNLDDNKGALELGYTFPFLKTVMGYLQYFHGYGESLLDYNHSVDRISIGIAFNDWL